MDIQHTIQAWADRLRHVDLREPWHWPVLSQALALVAVFFVTSSIGFYLVVFNQIDTLLADQAQEQTLKETYTVRKKRAIALELQRLQRAEAQEQYGALLRQLPDRTQVDAMLAEINQLGLARGLQFELFKPAGTEVMREFYAELPIQLRVVGAFHDFGSFAAAVAQLPRLVVLQELNISTLKDGVLQMDATARTFRYLDEEELAVQRKRAEKAKSEKK
jgi:type IV pilus assembly protein PilO